MRSVLLLPALALALAAPLAAAPVLTPVHAVIERTMPLDQAATFQPEAIATAYSNVSTFLGFSLLFGGVESDGVNTSTLFVADDLVPDPAYAGMAITSIRFSAASYAPVPVMVRIRVLVLNPDGPSGAPGTLIMGVIADPVVLPALTVSLITITAPAAVFPMPGGPFWAGMAFDDHDGTLAVTPSQLSSLGQGYFDPPTTGSSENRVFVTTTPFALEGSIFTRTSEPRYNFGWAFEVEDETPVQVSSWGRLKTLYR